MAIVSVTHFVITAVVMFTATLLLSKGRPSLLALFINGFSILDSLGLALAPYLPLEKGLPYVSNVFFLIRSSNTEQIYLRQILSHWVFLLAGWIGLICEASWRGNRESPWRKLEFPRLVLYAYLFLAAGFLAYIRYFIFGPGMRLLTGFRLLFSNTTEAVAARVQATRSVSLGQGAFMASMASKIAFPMAAMFWLRSGQPKSNVILALCCLLSGAYALQTYQKAPVLAVFLTYYLLVRLHERSNPVRSRRVIGLMILAGFVGIIVGAVFYAANFGLSLWEGVISTISRVLLVPGVTETNFFAVFPEVYPFRGIDRVFSIPLGMYPTNDVTIYDVAVAATGNRFSSNASLVAVAWSGAGYLGVAIIGFMFTSSLLLLDRGLQRVDSLTYLCISALVLPSTVALVSSGLADFAVNWGGIVIPALALVVYKMGYRRSRLSSKALGVES